MVTARDPRRAKFEGIAGEVFIPLQKYLLRRVQVDDVEDLLSETLLTLWRRLDDVPAGAPLPWCYGVARRTLANHRRGEARRLRLVERLRAEPTPLSVKDSDGIDPVLESALEWLSADDRELARLWAWEQLAPREIAVVLDSNANAVSLRLTRLKQKLARELDRQNSNPAGQKPGKRVQEK